MKRVVLCAAIALVPVFAFASGGQQTASAAGASGTVSSTSALSVTVPAVIGIDVESDMTFDF